MKAIKSEYHPRAIRIRKEQYLGIYHDCQVGRSYPVVFGRNSGVVKVPDAIAEYVINKYPNVSYVTDEPDAAPNYKEMSWGGLLRYAKSLGINCFRKSREAIESEIAEVDGDERAGS